MCNVSVEMLFTTLLPWVIVFYMQRVENGVNSSFKKNISQSLHEDLRDLCVSSIINLKKVKLVDANGEYPVKNWLMKFYLYENNNNSNENHFTFPRNHTVITIRNNEMEKKHLNLRLCDGDDQLLLYKLEVTHYVSRSKRSDRLKNNLEQSWSSDMFEQKFTDERGLEISVKVPRGVKTNGSHRHHPHHSSRDEEFDLKDDERTMQTELINSTTTTTTEVTTEATTLTTSYPLSETCQQYKMMVESVIIWSYNQLEKLKTGEIEGTGCLSKMSVKTYNVHPIKND